MRANILMILTSAALLLTGSCALADESPNRWQQSDPRTESSVPRPESIAQTNAGTGERVPTVLEAGLAEINEDYTGRMQLLKDQIATATPAEQEALQRQAQDLKLEWMVAFANRQLELARLRGDSEQEAEIQQALDHMLNPVQPQPQPVRRDPVTGEALKGAGR